MKDEQDQGVNPEGRLGLLAKNGDTVVGDHGGIELGGGSKRVR